MGLTLTDIEVAANREFESPCKVRFMIDSGAEYSVVSREVLKKVDVSPY